ncbi:hypothetical protein J5N97_020628 [Dioscorea zingiberensis]|uniref:Uncharacterized protein n=1 Tax=Dioscorea zingiberensis TaxID=325984 RepID=A0A9D5CGS5_9LILI|nr:hypothetical protein J5N97_020628 [Dioscorea zingiberensis]
MNPQDLSHALYLLGGSLNVIPSSAVQVFDATTSQWSLGPPISTAREFSATAVLTGQIYSSRGCCPLGDGAQPEEGESKFWWDVSMIESHAHNIQFIQVDGFVSLDNSMEDKP